jgi:lysyl-tRNA synthetase class 2
MTNRTGPAPTDPPAEGSRPARTAAGRPPDRRRQRRWVPLTVSALALLLGLADIVLGAEPGVLYRHVKHPLHRLAELVPGTLSNLTRTADVIIGLLLLLLSHGLRRRKHRAWQAVMVLLAVSVLIHYLHDAHHYRPIIVTVALLAILGFYHREFYAVGDPSTRWRALTTLGALIVADIAIGLTYISLSRHLAGDFTMAQRIQSVIWGLVGAHGPVYFAGDGSGDVFVVLTAGVLHVHHDRLPVPADRPAARPAERQGRRRDQGAAGTLRRSGLPGLLRAAQRQERDLVGEREVLHRLPGDVGRDARQR